MSMTEKEKAEIVEKGNKVVDVLMKTLKENMDCNESNTVLLEFVVAKFAALNVLDVQEMTNRTNIEDEVFAMMRMLMEILGKDMNVQSLKTESVDSGRVNTATAWRPIMTLGSSPTLASLPR